MKVSPSQFEEKLNINMVSINELLKKLEAEDIETLGKEKGEIKS